MKQVKGTIQICSCDRRQIQLHRHLEAKVAMSINLTHTSESAYWDAGVLYAVFW